jgi:CRP-like cAMP-binding protein
MNGAKITEISQLGAIFGEIAYFLNNDSSARNRCATDCEFFHIEEPKQFFRNSSDVIFNITRIMCSRVINLSKQVAMLKGQSEQAAPLQARDLTAEKAADQISSDDKSEDNVVF